MQETADELRQPVAMEMEHRLRLADGRTLACIELGEPEGQPVLYFHGCPGSRFEARIVASIASRLKIRLLAPDRPGLGASTFQNARTIRGWADDIRQLADRFALERFVIMGVSGGGPYALSCAAGMPERVDRVALVGAMSPVVSAELLADMPAIQKVALTAGLRSPRLARIVVELVARTIRAHPTLLLARMLARTGAADRAVLADPRYRALMLSSTVEALQQGGRGVAHELTLLARPWDIELRTIVSTVIVWQGLADTIVPVAMARYLTGVLASSTLRCLPQEGHLSLIVRHGERVFTDLTSDH